MKGITTIAPLPNGAGQAAHLKSEVGKVTAPAMLGVDLASGPDQSFSRSFTAEEIAKHFGVPWRTAPARFTETKFTPFSTVTVLGSEAPAVPVRDGEAKAQAVYESQLVTLHVRGVWGLVAGNLFTLNGTPYICASVRNTDDGGAEIGCYRDDRFPAIDSDMLDTSE